jgi:acetate kinase
LINRAVTTQFARRFDIAAKNRDLIDHRSGLLGISGVGGDMRRLHDASSTNPDARLAIEMFCYSVCKQIPAMIAALDGVDMIVFTGGIGENDGKVRASICAGLSWAGINLDPAQYLAMNSSISDPASRVLLQVLPSQEDEQIARHTWALSQRSISR